MATLTYSGTLEIVTCWCGIRHAIPDNLHRQARSDPEFVVFCPLGHKWVHRKSDAQVEREKREAAEERATRLRAQLDQTRAEAEHQAAKARGYKGALVQAKKRSAKGVCPVAGCKRHFVDVQRHVASKHPDYTGEVAG
jgi:hypothetical protein